MSSDILYIFVWWLFFLVIGIINLPLIWLLFRNFIDLGYGFAKTIGLGILSYLIFLFGTLKILPFSSFSLYFLFFLLMGLNIFIFSKNKAEIALATRRKIKVLVLSEILFSLGLVLWSIIRSYQPDIRGLEKFMDFGFINSILNSKYFPAIDMWFAGKPVNYYWFGHLVTAVATKFTGIPSSITYNLMLGTIMGVLFTGAFSLVASLFKSLSIKAKNKAFAAGVIALILVSFAGNLHTPIYLIKSGFGKYWYPDATRFIGYNPETDDKTIHEFPLYSFVVSDLHAHLLDLPFVLFFLALIWAFDNKLLSLIPAGIALGLMFMTNTWDYASYLMTAGFAFLFGKIIFQEKKIQITKALFYSGVRVIVIAGVGILTALPFILTFSSITQGIHLVRSHSPFWQLLVLWGFPLILTAAFLLTVFKLLKRKIEKADIFILAILASSWALIFIPEVVFVKDIYIASHYRANTMFKLTYQAFVMFYISGGYIAVRTITSVKSLFLKRLSILFFSILFTSILVYPFLAVNSYYGGLKNFRGLSGETWIGREYPNEYNAILWLRKNLQGQPFILEAPGDSYTDSNFIASYTGLPTVQGWFVHEWLWRGNSREPQQRVEDIAQIYNTGSYAETKELLDKYNVSYIIVGKAERKKYPNLIERKFEKLGKKVFSSGDLNIYLVRS